MHKRLNNYIYAIYLEKDLIRLYEQAKKVSNGVGNYEGMNQQGMGDYYKGIKDNFENNFNERIVLFEKELKSERFLFVKTSTIKANEI